MGSSVQLAQHESRRSALLLSPSLSPPWPLSPGTVMVAMVATVVAMEAMVATAMVDIVVVMAATATARGLLMPSPRLRLSLSPDMATGATAMVVMAATATARGLLMPSPGTAMVATATGATAM